MAQAVVGLGNPGTKYQGTRHNIGHRVLDRIVELLEERGELRSGFRRFGRLGQLAEGRCQSEPVLVFKTAGYMNESGRVVAGFLRERQRHMLAPSDLILVYDDIDLPLGKVRVRVKGSSGGHRGAQSVIDHLGTQAFRRVKVGIGRPGAKSEVADHVLSRFGHEELPLIETASDLAANQALKLVVERISQKA
ncbi:MAG: aminoacyl-tRNA hydrolase [Candidatus Methylomirabilia bacterium]